MAEEEKPDSVTPEPLEEESDLEGDATETHEAKRLNDFFSSKGSGFKDVDKFEEALARHSLTQDRLARVIDRLLANGAPAIKVRAMEALRRYCELVYGTEIRLRTEALEQETAEELERKREELLLKAQKLWKKQA